jgi:hypothetical protein
VVVAVDVGGTQLGGGRHGQHVGHLADHRRGAGREDDLLARLALPVGDDQQVRPEPVDLRQQVGLAGTGDPEHGDDRGDADRDSETGQ